MGIAKEKLAGFWLKNREPGVFGTHSETLNRKPRRLKEEDQIAS